MGIAAVEGEPEPAPFDSGRNPDSSYRLDQYHVEARQCLLHRTTAVGSFYVIIMAGIGVGQSAREA